MNKIIFQIGILGFCISAVVFGGNGGSLIDIVSRSFIVFVGIVIAATALVLVGGSMVGKNNDRTRNPAKAPESTHAQQK